MKIKKSNVVSGVEPWFARALLIKKLGQQVVADGCGVTKQTVASWTKKDGRKPNDFQTECIRLLSEGINPQTMEPI